MPGVDLDELWRRRRWRKLLGLIERLPPNSYYHQAIMNDPVEAERIAAAQSRARAEGKLSDKPSLNTWSAEVAMMAKQLDVLRQMVYVMQATNGNKNAKPPKPEPRPGTALEKADHQRRQRDHEALTARLIRR